VEPIAVPKRRDQRTTHSRRLQEFDFVNLKLKELRSFEGLFDPDKSTMILQRTAKYYWRRQYDPSTDWLILTQAIRSFDECLIVTKEIRSFDNCLILTTKHDDPSTRRQLFNQHNVTSQKTGDSTPIFAHKTSICLQAVSENVSATGLRDRKPTALLSWSATFRRHTAFTCSWTHNGEGRLCFASEATT
jgi:hypothetical protein